MLKYNTKFLLDIGRNLHTMLLDKIYKFKYLKTYFLIIRENIVM